jgi:hypothetical protein
MAMIMKNWNEVFGFTVKIEEVNLAKMLYDSVKIGRI